MTDKQKPTDYAELLGQLECGPHDQCIIEKAAAAIRFLIGERDVTEAERAHHDIMRQSLRVDLDLLRQRVEAAEARAAASENRAAGGKRY